MKKLTKKVCKSIDITSCVSPEAKWEVLVMNTFLQSKCSYAKRRLSTTKNRSHIELSNIFQFVPEGNISLRNNFLKLKRPFRNTNTGRKALSFIGPSFWNQIPESLKKTDNLNTFKYNLKKRFFN